MCKGDIQVLAVVLFPECWWSGWVSQAPGFLGSSGVRQKKLAEAPSLLLALVLCLCIVLQLSDPSSDLHFTITLLLAAGKLEAQE